MEGPDIHDVQMKGLIPRMFDYLFEKIEEAPEEIEFNIRCSYIEIYMEKIADLLDRKCKY
jgi:kinesin family protein 5